MFKFRLKWCYEALIIDGTVPSGHLGLNLTAVPGVFDKMMDMDTLNFHLLRRFQAKNGIGIQFWAIFGRFEDFLSKNPWRWSPISMKISEDFSWLIEKLCTGLDSQNQFGSTFLGTKITKHGEYLSFCFWQHEHPYRVFECKKSIGVGFESEKWSRIELIVLFVIICHLL